MKLSDFFPLAVLCLLSSISRTMAQQATSGSPFRVDVHTHPIPEFYREALYAAGYPGENISSIFVDGFLTPYPFSIDSYLAARREQGYNFSILSITAPGLSFLKGNALASSY